jgi:hypothetical protein
MKSEFLKNFPHIWLEGVALVLFFAFFVTLFLRVYKPKDKKNIESLGRIPLDHE